MGIILIVLLSSFLGGAFFFIEFEEIPDEDELTSDDSPSKKTLCLGRAENASHSTTTSACSNRCSGSSAAASQHPGWLWDQAPTNGCLTRTTSSRHNMNLEG